MKLLLVGIFFLTHYIACETTNPQERMQTKEEAQNDIHEFNCERMGKDPQFEIDPLLRHKWRIYHTWGTRPISTKCVDVTFSDPKSKVRTAVRLNIEPYLINQPNWAAAALYMSIGSSGQDVLLFADNGPAGRFTGVPAKIHDEVFPRNLQKGMILLQHYQFKLLNDGKFLAMLDCKVGTAALLARVNDKISPGMALAAANSLKFREKGYATCMNYSSSVWVN